MSELSSLWGIYLIVEQVSTGILHLMSYFRPCYQLYP